MAGQEFTLQVNARLPDKIGRLTDLAGNFWFSWHRPTRQLFALLDRDLWWRVGRNPKVFLRCVDQAVLDMAVENETFLASYRRVLAEFDSYCEQRPTRYAPASIGAGDLVAYFCAEYGFHDSAPLYSGGLGILAGDHCKTASDLRLPFVAVGLLYRKGYFTQRIDENGHQLVEYRHTPAENMPVVPVRDAHGGEIVVQVRFPGRLVNIKVWRADVGRVPVILLDTDVAENTEADRQITRALYGGDQTTRIQQEIVLGIGGVRAQRAAGFAPTVWHINEGHPAFMVVERACELTRGGLPFAAALEAVAACTVFTTHTVVAAGHDAFPADLVLEYLGDQVRDLGIATEAFLALGQAGNGDQRFNMTRLAVSGARSINGVSQIHGGVSANVLAGAWPDVPPQENPVGYVTNGVHVPTFMREEWSELLDQQVGAAWRFDLMDRALIDSIMNIPDGRFWYVKQRVKSETLNALRNRIGRQHTRNRVSGAHIHRLLRYIDPENANVLTIGFARRFATYKRATLLFSDLGWLQEIVDHDERPVVFIFAGKAHPADEPGQQLMREVHRVANLPQFFGKILLVEGYDIDLAGLLTAGVDIWLNNPIYPMEASGTSGMKAAINGTVNLSVLDGWWAEGYEGDNGWAVPPAAMHNGDDGERDRQDARTLYEILQDDIIPLYYRRDEKLGYSPGWVEVCKRSMASVLPHFNSHRLLHDYACNYYGPAAAQGRLVAAQDFAPARELAEWKARVHAAWGGVALRLAQPVVERIAFDAKAPLEVAVRLNGLTTRDVRVECLLHRELCSEVAVPVRQYSHHGRAGDGVRHLGTETVFVAPLVPQAEQGEEVVYRLDLASPWCGGLRYSIRALPQHRHLTHPHETGLMRWL